MASVLAYRWDGQRTRLYFHSRPGAYNKESIVEFLREIDKHFPGQNRILIWDRLPAHRSGLVTEYLSTHSRWCGVEWLPAYAPDTNPVDVAWANLKGLELANLCPDGLGEAFKALVTGMKRMRRTPSLLFAFLRHTGISF